MGFEPTTFSLARRRSTTELHPLVSPHIWGLCAGRPPLLGVGLAFSTLASLCWRRPLGLPSRPLFAAQEGASRRRNDTLND